VDASSALLLEKEIDKALLIAYNVLYCDVLTVQYCMGTVWGLLFCKFFNFEFMF
jgi:hypothetical protein